MNEPPNPPRKLRVTEVAALLGVSPKTVRNMIDRGHFPGARKIDPTRRNSPYLIPAGEVNGGYQQIEFNFDEPDKSE